MAEAVTETTTQPQAPANAVQVNDVKQEDQAALKSQSRRKIKILVGVAIAVLMLYLLYKSMKKSEKQTGASEGGPLSRVLGGILGFNRSGDSELVRDAGKGDSAGGVVPRHPGMNNQMPDFGLEAESDHSLKELAMDLKEAGFTLQGVSHCKWTKIQREMFGDRDSEARKLLESMYIECRGEEMCPGVRGYPTWVRGDNKYAGFQPPAKLRTLAAEMKKVDPTPMLQGAAEPLSENIPDAKHDEEIPTQLNPDMAKNMGVDVAKQIRASESGDIVAAVESDRDGAGVALDFEDAKPTMPPKKKENCENGIKKEYARGVSAYAPLNVPDMPGTAPMNLDLQHTDFQTMQGNTPRAAFANHEPMAQLAQQVIRSFDNLSEHARRDPMASSYSQTRMPHSSDITTGDPLADKRIPVRENPSN